MLRSKWVMLCPMARSGSSHTSELLDAQPNMRSHHGLFSEGPFGRWPADPYLPAEQLEYYSSILDDRFRRVGGQEAVLVQDRGKRQRSEPAGRGRQKIPACQSNEFVWSHRYSRVTNSSRFISVRTTATSVAASII
jgi:hypothetical protein